MAKKDSSPDSVEHNLSNSYIPKEKQPKMPSLDKPSQKDEEKDKEKIKKDIDLLSEQARKDFKFIDAIGVVPSQASKVVEAEYEIPEAEAKKGLVHVLVVIPESKFKEIAKIKTDLIKKSKEINEKFWIHTLTPIDFWNMGLDSKFDSFEAFSMSYPVHDPKNFLGSLRVSHIHKSLVLRKFEKYVTTYAMGGSFVRGETKKTSDIDVIVIIDDTDVKRMSRFELIEKLRGIIHSYISEAMAMAGTKVDFNVQVWLLTDFWERVKDAEPVAFTFIRDGIPLYDRGAFLPWKSLLRMGRIKPSPESVDMFMSSGDKMKTNVEKKIFDILIHDIYWGTMHPTQGLLMLYGLAPQNVYDTAKSFRETFVEKERLIEESYADFFEEIALKYYKGFEHGKVKSGDITGNEIDRLFKGAKDYVKRLKDLRTQIEKRVKENEMDDVYKNLFDQLKAIIADKPEDELINDFGKNFVKNGKFPKRYLTNLKFIKKVYDELKNPPKKKKTKKEKSDKKQAEESYKLRRNVDNARKKATEIINALTEYSQRADFFSTDRARFILKGKEKTAEVFFLKNTYYVHGTELKKVEADNLVDTTPKELEAELVDQHNRENKIDFSALEVIKKEIGDFDLVY